MLDKFFSCRSVLLLVGVNLYPLVMALTGRWSIPEILVLYWFESAIIGFFNILKMIRASGVSVRRTENVKAFDVLQKLFLCCFFTVHYGMFMAVHAVFLSLLAHISSPSEFLGLLWEMRYAIAGLFISHAYSFWFNFIKRKEFLSVSQAKIMLSPYPRIIVMQLTIIFGMWMSLLFKSGAGIISLFVALKIVVDGLAHLKERERSAARV